MRIAFCLATFLASLSNSYVWSTEPPISTGGGAIVSATAAYSTPFVLTNMRDLRETLETGIHLKKLAFAMHYYEGKYHFYPTAAICDQFGRPLLSWRVAILPFVGQMELYKQFRLNEAWDSAHNKPLIVQMPRIFATPGITGPADTKTHFQVFCGNGAMFELKKQLKIADALDGSSNTILVAEARDPVTWTQPVDLGFDPAQPLPKLGKRSPKGFLAVMGDGQMVFFKHTMKEKMLKAFVTRDGGEIVVWDDMDP